MFGHSARFGRLKPGIDYLRADRRAHRQKTFQELVNYWVELGRRRLWDELTATVKAPAPEPPNDAPPLVQDIAGADAQSTPADGPTASGGNGHPASDNPRLVGDASAVP